VSLPLYTADQVRALDQQLIAAGTPGISLMQRAAEAALTVLRQRWPQTTDVLVLCGRGNNGGDGHVLSGLLLQTGARVHLLQIGDIAKAGADARQAAANAAQLGVGALPYDAEQLTALLAQYSTSPIVIVDAMLGTGFHGALAGDFADAVGQVNASGQPILALDIPSGLQADTGHVAGQAIRATITVTFIARKRGLYTASGPEYAGEIVFDDCGADALPVDTLRPAIQAIDVQLLRHVLRPRPRSAHKGQAGSVLVIGGDTGFGGAAMLAAEAAARSGAGTVSLLTRPAHVTAMLARRPEVMVTGMDTWQSDIARQLVEKASVLIIGPGLGQSRWSRQMLQNSMMWAVTMAKPLLLDADALNLAAQDDSFWRESAPLVQRNRWVITPHPGEAARLLATSVAQVQCDRFAAIGQLQALTGTQCLLKGAGSLLAFMPDDGRRDADGPRLELCTEGNPGMASGGMGDILTGVIAALMAQGLSAADALRCGVCAHGEAADQAVAAVGERGLLATDVLTYLPQVLNGYHQ
jgi:hydroxyethylthiazole kinase-like uncharacterized protein yjeF